MSGEQAGGGHHAGELRLKVPDAGGADLMHQLRATLERAAELVRALETSLREAEARKRPANAEQRADELEHRLAKTEGDVTELASQLATSERQTSRLMNLYVATYQLHASLLPTEVQSTIAEIAVNLLGAERFVLLLRNESENGCEIALSQGLDDAPDERFAAPIYRGGVAIVDATLADGVVRLGEGDQPDVVAVVPLRVQGDIVGAVVLLKLLDHKPSLRSEDRELLDLLSAHAASALFAARLFASTDRRLRSLESLVKLARGE
jgi:GAF domain